jgi:hypothetical protein
VNHSSSGTTPSAPDGSAQAGTEYGPQWMKMPNLARAYHWGSGRASVAHSSGLSTCSISGVAM